MRFVPPIASLPHLLRAAALAASLAGAVPASAASVEGIALPDTQTAGGTALRLNGMALRTYSVLRFHIYVAGLYLEQPTHDAEAILRSPEKKQIVVHFLRDVDAEKARDAWREGFQDNCRPPCHLAPADVARFLAQVPTMRAGDVSTLTFTPAGVDIATNGRSNGSISDPAFATAVLATFIGPVPPTPRLKAGLLGLSQ